MSTVWLNKPLENRSDCGFDENFDNGTFEQFLLQGSVSYERHIRLARNGGQIFGTVKILVPFFIVP